MVGFALRSGRVWQALDLLYRGGILMRCYCTSRVVGLWLGVVVGGLLSAGAHGADIGFLVDPDTIVDQPFDQFWVQRLQDQGHNVTVLPANYQPDDPGAVSADIFIGSNDIGSGDFISNPNIARQFNLNPIDLSGANDVEVSVLLAAGSEGFDVGADFLRFRADEDGDGSYETLLTEFLPTEFGELQQVGGDEVILDPFFQEVTFAVPDNITTLRLQVEPFTTAPAEQFGFDNIRVTSGNGATTIESENFEGGAGQVGFTTVGQGVGNPNQFFDLSNAEGVTPDIEFEDFEGEVWFGGADVDANFAFGATFRLTDPRPLITYEDALFDELQMAQDPATGRSDGDTITIVDADHPLAAGLQGDEFGDVFVYDGVQGITFLGAPEELAEAVDVVAVDLDGQAVIAVLEKGAIGLNGEPSPGQRIGIFAHDAGDGSLYTEEGLALLDAAVAHALASITEDNLLDCNGDGVVDAADLDCACDAGIQEALLEELGILAGDLDGNGEVAFADFLVLSANFGQQVDGGHAAGDIDCNGAVEFADFLALSANFGQTSGAELTSIPEPSGVSLLLLGLGLCAATRRGRR